MAKPKLKIRPKIKLRISGDDLRFGDIVLPSAPSEPSELFIDYSYLIYGRKKIGKTSLISHFENSLFFMFEPGAKALRIYMVPQNGCFTDWEQVRKTVRLLKKGGHEFRTAVFDPGNKAYDLCLKWVCGREGIIHPGKEKDFGASWKAVSTEFENIHAQLATAGLAFVVLAHEGFDEKRGMVIPKFSPSTEDFYEGVIDNIWHYDYDGDKRFMLIRGNESIVAGTRCEGRYLTRDGRPIYKIPMGNSSAEGFQNIMSAWNNDQERSYGPDEKREKLKRKLILKKSR